MKRELLAFGNHKLPDDTATFNMCPAVGCPASRLGLCKIEPGKCYCLKAEQPGKNGKAFHPGVLEYRIRQMNYWQTTDVDTKVRDLAETLKRKRNPVKAFRFNESGDLSSKQDLDDVCIIARSFPAIRFYLYTARTDIMQAVSVEELPDNLNVLIANADIPGFDSFTAVHGFSNKRGTYQCKGNCRLCHVCTVRKQHTMRIEVKYH